MPRETSYLSGMKECREALAELSRSMQTGVGKRALLETGKFFAGRISDLAPVSSRPNDPTPSSLKAAPKAVANRPKKGQPRVAIIVDDPAAVPNEFGLAHRDYPARPFARPAVDANREAGAAIMAAGLKTETDAAIARAARRGSK